MADRALLTDVVRYKRVFFRADYDQCLTGGLRFVPDEPLLSALRRDYDAMVAAGMLYGAYPSFDDIVRLTTLQEAINRTSRDTTTLEPALAHSSRPGGDIL
jgi:hypothetical protein